MESGSRHVLCMKMPPLEGVSSHRKDAMAEHGMSLMSQKPMIAS